MEVPVVWVAVPPKPSKLPLMDRFKFTTIAHRHHAICNPISSESLDAVLAALALGPEDTAIDIGCGKGEALIRLGERYGVIGTGLDVNPEFLKIAERESARRLRSGMIAFHLTEATSFQAQPDSYTAAICLGSTHAYGSFGSALESLARLVHPGGSILIGEGYWRREPDPGYLHLLGAERDELNDHAGNIAQGAVTGLHPLTNRESSLAEWDAYEDLYAETVEEYLQANPDDPDATELRDRVRSWRDGYLRWGRDTLGFGTYTFRKPAP